MVDPQTFISAQELQHAVVGKPVLALILRGQGFIVREDFLG